MCARVSVYTHYDLNIVYWRHIFPRVWATTSSDWWDSFLYPDMLQAFLSNFYSFLNIEIINHQSSLISFFLFTFWKKAYWELGWGRSQVKFLVQKKNHLRQRKGIWELIYNERWVYWQLPESSPSSLIFSFHILLIQTFVPLMLKVS